MKVKRNVKLLKHNFYEVVSHNKFRCSFENHQRFTRYTRKLTGQAGILNFGGGCWGFTTVPVTKTIRLSEWVNPGDTAKPGMTSLKDGDLQHSSALAQSPKEI